MLRHVLVDLETMTKTPIPDWLRLQLEPWTAGQLEPWTAGHLAPRTPDSG